MKQKVTRNFEALSGAHARLTPLSLNQDIPHSFDPCISIFCTAICLVSTRVGVMVSPSSAGADSGVTGTATIFIIR